MKIKQCIFIFLLLTFIPLAIFADQYDADRHQLKLMLVDIEKKLNEKDFNGILPYLSHDAVVTFYDGRTAVGPENVNKYIEKMLTGPSPVLKKFTVKGVEDSPAMVYPIGVATAYGAVQNTFDFVTGEKMDVNGRWSVTLLKEKNVWKIIALHFSTNLFDNPIVKAFERKIIFIGLFALITGLVIGYFIRVFVNRKRANVSR